MTSEPLDPKKYHVLSKKKKVLVFATLVILATVLIPTIGFYYYKFAVLRPSQKTDETTFQVNSGESVSEISTRLYEEDAINSEFLFKAYVVWNDLNLQAGVYTIPGGTSVAEIARMLQHGRNDTEITFIEGWRAEEFAALASQNFSKIDYVEFVKVAKEHEGYLFPDTYSFSVEVTEQEMIEKLLQNFEAKTENILTQENLANANLTREQAVIFASILEREVNNPEDMPVVAGILIKRWKVGELIGADATTQYIVAAHRYGCVIGTEEVCPNAEDIPNINWWPYDLTIEELDTDNPYNTREVVGLPPAPIANPGLNSLEAVLNYQDSEYFYYLTDEDGVTHYAETLEGHTQNIADHL